MTSREIFEAWYHPNFFVDPKTLAWEVWKQSRKNLEAEQAQAVEPVTGERADLIHWLRERSMWDGMIRLIDAANMLEADATRITELESSLDFYQRRVELLQKWQSKMRDPERTIACDIIANGQTLPPENAGDRYKIPVEAQQVAVPDGYALVPIEPTPAILDAMSSSGWKTACYKAMLAAAQGAKLVTKQDSRPQNCGTTHCSCIECPYPKTDWSAA